MCRIHVEMAKKTNFKREVGKCFSKNGYFKFALFVFLGIYCKGSFAFTLYNMNGISQKQVKDQRLANVLKMSSVGQDNEFSAWIHSKLPDPPEDQISMIGDISCLFLYSFLDHTVNRMYDQYLNSPETVIMKSAISAIETSAAAQSELSLSFVANDNRGSLPVWFDPLSSAPYGNVPLNSALPIEHHITYAPAISSVGSASVLLCSIWMLCGYMTEAFHFKNTVECSRSQAILVTTKTWILTSIIMMMIAYASDILLGSIDSLHKITGLSRVDTDFILDSLSVLLVWRFILSSFFGPTDKDYE